jgi:hypothetical protein
MHACIVSSRRPSSFCENQAHYNGIGYQITPRTYWTTLSVLRQVFITRCDCRLVFTYDTCTAHYGTCCYSPAPQRMRTDYTLCGSAGASRTRACHTVILPKPLISLSAVPGLTAHPRSSPRAGSSFFPSNTHWSLVACATHKQTGTGTRARARE